MALLAWVLLVFLGPVSASCPQEDEHGCCVSRNSYFCFSSAKCVVDSDVCEDLVTTAMPSCSFNASGASFDLSKLRKTKAFEDYETEVDEVSLVFGVCSNAATPKNCVSQESLPAAAFAVYGDCHRLAGAIRESFTPSLLNASDPSRGVSLRYEKGQPCDFLDKTYSLRVDIQCWPAAINYEMVSATQLDPCSYVVVMRSAESCPRECQRGMQGAVCSGRGTCVSDRLKGVHCDCRGNAFGAACERGSPFSHNDDDDQLWKSFALFAVFFGALALIFQRCRAIRRARANEMRFRYRPGLLREDDGLELNAYAGDDVYDDRGSAFLRL